MIYNYKIKLITGFRRDQEHSVDANEAHKAYYLFLNPDQRGVFSDGFAIIGSEIKEIKPDYLGTMGWNPTHTLDSDDYNELRDKGVDESLRKYLSAGKEIAQFGDLSDLNLPLKELVLKKYPQLAKSTAENRGGGFKRISAPHPTDY